MAEQSSKPKRQVKNPETFRERVIKAAETSTKPAKTHRVRQAFRRGIRIIFLPIGRVLRPIVKSKFFRSKPARLLGRIIFPRYLRGSLKELKLVTWPNWTQSRDLTFAVLVFAIVFGAVIATVDYGLDKVFKQLLLK